MTSETVFLLLIFIDCVITLINLAVLGLAVKLYTDQTKQGILRRGGKA